MNDQQTTPVAQQLGCNTFYKYVKIEDCLKILTEGTLWYSEPKKFNDPFDCYPFFPQKGKDKLFKRLKKEHGLDLQTSKKRLRNNFISMSQTGSGGIMHNLVSNNLTVTCFSKDHLSVPMWAHYADKHQGCVIEFQLNSEVIEKISRSQPNVVIVPSEVKYTDDRQPLYDKNGQLFGLNIALSKSTQWAYEKEVRALSNREGIHHFSRLQISKVFTGVRINEIDKVSVKNAVGKMNSSIGTKCKVVELCMAFDSYQFVELQ